LIAALVLFDSDPGINWTIWTVITATGLVAYRRPDRDTLRAIAMPLGFAVVISIGAIVTTVPLLIVAIPLTVAWLLALSILIVPESAADDDYGALDIVTAPFRGLFATVKGSAQAINAAVEASGTSRRRSILRGALLATPVVIVLALLFSAADPVLASIRDAILDAISRIDVIPRTIFGIVVTLFVAGAYLASRTGRTPSRAAGGVAQVAGRVGLAERQIVLASAAVISWIFVLLQIGYLFSITPSAAGSGMTFAEYAHRGFGELTIAATGVGLLIVAAYHRLSPDDARRARSALKWPAMALIVAVCCILVSAFHRVSLYEAAYGFTSERVYAQAYMILTLAAIIALAWHVAVSFDARMLARWVLAIALSTLVVMIFWNTDAWVARADLDRYAATGKIDVEYMGRGLSADAYPVLIQSLDSLREPEQGRLASLLAWQYNRRHDLHLSRPWYEWNIRMTRARRAWQSSTWHTTKPATEPLGPVQPAKSAVEDTTTHKM
jgi:hypothetical protein